MNRRTIVRRRRGYWALALVLAALLVRMIVDGDAYRTFFAGIVLVCWLALRRDWIDGGLE